MFEEIKNLLIEFANVDENKIKLDAKLKDDLGIDSLYAVELILELETHYEINIEFEDIQNLFYVSDVVDLVQRKVDEKNGK
ncbi:MAG: acyl carrier protein [Acholeplasmatales bacterium]|jgi:acyl carrier protein|nr:acyl carrier protein [Acholeplasmatales bacterium]